MASRLPGWASIRRTLDELGGVEIDDAVAVEDDEFHAASAGKGNTRRKAVAFMPKALKCRPPGSWLRGRGQQPEAVGL